MKKLLSTFLTLLLLLSPLTSFAATVFMEAGGNADGQVGTTNGFWRVVTGTPAVATDFTHAGQPYSIKFRPGNVDVVKSPLTILQNAGNQISFWIYIAAYPAVGNSDIFVLENTTPATVAGLSLSSTGVLNLVDSVPNVLAAGPTLALGKWYHISLAYNVTSTTVNQFGVWVNDLSAIQVTNVTLVNVGIDNMYFGNINTNSLLDYRLSDVYANNATAIADVGNVYVTAKRPFSNGTTNGFSTQIGSGGSSYGTGHAPQVNERPLSVTNGWSMVGVGSAITEEYSIEGKQIGDANLNGATIVDEEGWVSASSLAGETASIIVGGVSSNISLTTTNTLFKKIAGSTIYPAGGTDIGIITTTALTTVSLFENGLLIAYIPPPNPSATMMMLGIGF